MNRTFRELEVHVKPVVPEDQLHMDDQDVPRITKIAVNAEFPDGHAAGIAKDVFSVNVPVKELDDFEMKVIDPSTGRELDEAPEYVLRSGLKHGHLMDSIDLDSAVSQRKSQSAEPGIR